MRLAFRIYRRRFRVPLRTAHGDWRDRLGVILRLDDARGHSGYGEIAPLPWFGTETLEEAIAYLTALGAEVDVEAIARIPAHLPATQFGLGSAWEALTWGQTEMAPLPGPSTQSKTPIQPSPSQLCALLPAGEAALREWSDRYAQGYRCFKWKIGVQPLAQDLALLDQLHQDLPKDARLRLDANGGLDRATATVWLQHCDRLPNIECLEQPLPPSQWSELQALAQNHPTPIALDESVGTIPQVQSCQRQGWRGLYVLKGAIAGFPWSIRNLGNQGLASALIVSSVFETAIARQAVYRLAGDLQVTRALGFGVGGWLEEDGLDDPNPEQLWQTLT